MRICISVLFSVVHRQLTLVDLATLGVLAILNRFGGIEIELWLPNWLRTKEDL